MATSWLNPNKNCQHRPSDQNLYLYLFIFCCKCEVFQFLLSFSTFNDLISLLKQVFLTHFRQCLWLHAQHQNACLQLHYNYIDYTFTNTDFVQLGNAMNQKTCCSERYRRDQRPRVPKQCLAASPQEILFLFSQEVLSSCKPIRPQNLIVSPINHVVFNPKGFLIIAVML